MKYLTKRAALRLTVEVWDWLSEDGSRGKEDWPEWDRVVEEYGTYFAEPCWPSSEQTFVSLCPLCEYTIRHDGSCQLCPLLNKWNGHKICCGYGAPFALWERARYNKEWKEAVYYAKMIADLARQELKRLDAKA